jgi:hypothetical protein
MFSTESCSYYEGEVEKQYNILFLRNTSNWTVPYICQTTNVINQWYVVSILLHLLNIYIKLVNNWCQFVQ